MKPDWTQVLRFTPRSALRFSLSLSPNVRTLLEQSDERSARWIKALDQATLNLVILEPAHCTLQGRIGNEGAYTRFELAATPHLPPQEGYRVTVSLSAPDHQHGREFKDLILMLSGNREAIVAKRNAGETTPYVRLRYPAHGARAEIALFTPALAERLPRPLLTLLPSVMVLGHVQQLT